MRAFRLTCVNSKKHLLALSCVSISFLVHMYQCSCHGTDLHEILFWGFHEYLLRNLRFGWTRQRSRYSDCLWAGRSGDRIPVEAKFSTPVQTSPEAHPASCTMGTGCFPGVRCSRGVTLTPHPLLVPRSKIEQSYTSVLPKGRHGL